MARRRNDEIQFTDREPYVRNGRLMPPRVRRRPVQRARPVFECIDLPNGAKLYTRGGDTDASFEEIMARWLRWEHAFATGVHQQHRRNVEAWRTHVLQGLVHIHKLMQAGHYENARLALIELARRIHEAPN